MDETFRRFVLTTARSEKTETSKTRLGPSTWTMVKTPLLILLIISTAFLFLTQQERYQSVIGGVVALNNAMPALIAYASALTAAAAVLLRLLDMFRGQKGDG
jgi:cobalamin synthase